MTAAPSAPKNSFNFNDLSPERKVIVVSSLSVAVAAILVILKGVTLYASGSLSILASLTDSGLDLLASLITFYAVRYAKTPPDKEHPFGHGKAEAFSALFQAGLVFASGALIMQSAIHDFLHPKPVLQSGWAIGVLLISVVLTLGLVSFQNVALKSAQSVAVSADRMHYVTDLVSNLIAIAGVTAASFGFFVMDAVAGFVMAVYFIWGAVQVLREAADHLMDHALPAADQARIRDLVAEDSDILGVHELRTRLAGPYILIQMHVELTPTLTLDEAHKIIISAEKRLIAAYPNADIIIHPDPKGLAEPHSGVFQEVLADGDVGNFDTRQASEA